MEHNQINCYQIKKNIFHCEGGRWALSFCVAFIILGITYLIVKPVFMTIDDARLLYVYAGYATGTPEMNYLFSYMPVGALISSLYRLQPAVPWYGLYHLFTILLGSTIIGKTIYKLTEEKGLPVLAGIAYHAFLYISLCLISTIMIHFEITATIIGTAGAVLLLGLRPEMEPRLRTIADSILATFCITFCFCIQYNSFYAICCYLLVVIAYHVFQSIIQKTLKRTLITIGLVLVGISVLCGGVKIWENQAKSTPEWQRYLSYNKYRVSFWDYPHMRYADNPELFEEMGWTENFYTLTENMYFMDERFNEEALASFTTRFSWTKLGSFEEMKTNFQSSLTSLYKERVVKLQGLVAAPVMLLLLVQLLSKKTWKEKKWASPVAGLCSLVGTTLIVCFLAVRGRLPLRAWLAIIIPCGMVTSLLLVGKTEVPKTRKLLTAVCGIICMAFLCVWGYGVYHTYSKMIMTDVAYRVQSNQTVAEAEKYAISHPDRVLIYDNYSCPNYNVFTYYSNETKRPTNMFGWGSSYLFTPAYYKQLGACNKEILLTANLFDQDVVFVTNPKKQYLSILMKMLQEEEPNASYKGFQKIGDNLVVFRLTK